MKPIDYTLYNRVKEKFPPQPYTVIFVSLAPENIEELHGIAFTIENLDGFADLVSEHAEEAIPHAVIGGVDESDVGYNFSCHEFEQQEDLLTGKVIGFSVGTYHNRPPDIEALKKEMKNFSSGTLLSGNA